MKKVSEILSGTFLGKSDTDYRSDISNPVKVENDIDMRLSERNSLNRLCDIRDWEAGGTLSQIMSDLKEGSYIHRKSWEYAMCIYGLETLGAVTPESHAIAVGAGYERPLFYFANRIKRMVATDLYDSPGLEGDPSMLTTPEKFAPFPYNEDGLDVLRMDGTDLKFNDNTFDFAFSLSSIEHFGSRDDITKAMSEMFRVLKPNGVLCLATELILNNARHPEYFTFDELNEYILGSNGFKLAEEDIDLRISRSLLLNPIDLDTERNLHISPHIVLKQGNVIWTSIILFLKKEGLPQ
ncbi:MAG: class I SAM-dependent methyltransferase [Methanolobus sp.]|nr:class I SAM-dependent methyltransferase [Methanolobus sp.]